MKIKTEFVYPPIPIRSCDWCAYDDDSYDGPGSVIGHGATEQEAIADFKESWEERYGSEKLVEFEGYFRSQEFVANALGLRKALSDLAK